jgi:hypothetical protein
MERAPKIRLPGGGALVLDYDKGTFVAEGNADPRALAVAQRMAKAYVPSPTHGYPGYMLVSKVAKAVGGVAELPPVPPMPPGAIP